MVKVKFEGPSKIADPLPVPGAKGAKTTPPPATRKFEFGKDGGKVVDGSKDETPYITIRRAPGGKLTPEAFKIVDGLGQEHAAPSQYFIGTNNLDTLVFKRMDWKQYGELYLTGPGEQKIALINFLPVEEQAAWKLQTAKIFADAKQTDKAKEMYQQIIKQYARTRAAKEAQQLLTKLNK